MGRTAYHRAYYWKRLESRRATARRCRAAWRHRQRVIKALCEGIDEAQKCKTPAFGEGFTSCGDRYTLGIALASENGRPGNLPSQGRATT